MLFKEIVPVHSENHIDPASTKCRIYWLLKKVVHMHVVITGL
jgi:hypothetical protein